MALSRKHYIEESSAYPNDGQTVRGLTCTNLIQWTGFDGAFLTPWQGENCVALQYGIGMATGPGDIWTASFTTKSKIGPTASASSCSACRTKQCSADTPTNAYFFKQSPLYQSPVDMQNGNFIGGGYIGGDGGPKPSTCHLLFGIWFDYTSENPVGTPPNQISGVSETSVGAGDILYIEGLGGGYSSRTWVFTSWNQRQLYNPSNPLPKSTDWKCGDALRAPKGIWIEMPIRDYPAFRISIRPTGWARSSPQPNADLFAPPNGLRYYVAAYVMETCGLGQAQPGNILGSIESPSVHPLRAHRMESG